MSDESENSDEEDEEEDEETEDDEDDEEEENSEGANEIKDRLIKTDIELLVEISKYMDKVKGRLSKDLLSNYTKGPTSIHVATNTTPRSVQPPQPPPVEKNVVDQTGDDMSVISDETNHSHHRNNDVEDEERSGFMSARSSLSFSISDYEHLPEGDRAHLLNKALAILENDYVPSEKQHPPPRAPTNAKLDGIGLVQKSSKPSKLKLNNNNAGVLSSFIPHKTSTPQKSALKSSRNNLKADSR